VSNILYVCDRKECTPCIPECKYTSNILQAKNFKRYPNKSEPTFIEKNNTGISYRVGQLIGIVLSLSACLCLMTFVIWVIFQIFIF